MSSLLPPGFSSAAMPSQIRTTRQLVLLQVRAHSFNDEAAGRSSNLVDGNMKVLRERIERVRAKEKEKERSCTRYRDEVGWSYTNSYYKHKKEETDNLCEYFQTLGLAGGISGLTILTATAFLCLVSLIAHFHL